MTSASPFVPILCPSTGITQDNIYDITSKYNYVLTLPNNQDISADTLNRKSFYESQQHSNLIIWNLWIIAVYYVLSIVLIIILFVSENQFQLTNYQKGGATIILLLYPHIISFIMRPIIWLYKFVSSFMPHNVYTSI